MISNPAPGQDVSVAAKAELFRAFAEYARKRAGQALDRDLRNGFVAMANGWGMLAEEVERWQPPARTGH